MTSNIALVVEDDPNTAKAFSKVIASLGYNVLVAGSLKEAREQLSHCEDPAVIVLDYQLPDGDGLSLTREAIGGKHTRYVVITGNETQEVAVASLRAKVDDFIVKPVSVKELRQRIGRHDETAAAAVPAPANDSHVDEQAVRDAARQPAQPSARLERLMPKTPSVAFIGSSRQADRLREAVRTAARSKLNVLIHGAVGSEKTAIAHAVYQRSLCTGDAVYINCGSLVDSRAVPDANGWWNELRRAEKGVFVLSDVTALAMDQQKVLSSLLGRFDNSEQADFSMPRIISILHESGLEAIDEGRLDADLYYRLSQYQIRVPSLKERIADIEDIAKTIVDRLNHEQGASKYLVDEALKTLCQYSWPGNYRELSNVIGQCYMGKGNRISIDPLLVEEDEDGQHQRQAVDALVGKTFWKMEEALLKATLDHLDGNKPAAAEMLGISLKTLYNRLKAYS